jgi:hypothetical protein
MHILGEITPTLNRVSGTSILFPSSQAA